MIRSTLDEPREAAFQYGHFTDVDATGDADPYVAILDSADRLSHIVANRQRVYELLSVEPGDSVVDVGCGAGYVVNELSAGDARAAGVDASEHMIATARRRFSAL